MMPEEKKTGKDELKPCPFCGELPAIHAQETTFSVTGEIWSILCNCEQAKATGRTKERLIERWNIRHDS
jgi:Lar family restriction alleviation protein